MTDAACVHEPHELTHNNGVDVEGYVLVGYLCRKCGEWIKA